MNVIMRVVIAPRLFCVAILAGIFLSGTFAVATEQPAGPDATGQYQNPVTAPACDLVELGSPYVPVDSWVYPAMWRLYSLGFMDQIFLGIRPWTRASMRHMLDAVPDKIEGAKGTPATDEAQGIYDALARELQLETKGACGNYPADTRVESIYTIGRGLSGTPLRDSFHLGSTIINDYGRPYSNGFNNYSGASGYLTAGRFVLYARGEFQGAPSTTGYSPALFQTLSVVDNTINPVTGVAYGVQSTIPQGPIGRATQGRFLEVYLSYFLLNHEISLGKQDDWMGPGIGGGMAFSNNAENFYSFHVNRVEPLRVPGLSRLTGPFRYEFMVGELRGHTLMPNPIYLVNPSPAIPNVVAPGNPWVHVEKVSFKPTENLEFGFERTGMFGGEGHEPVTLHSFLKSFFSLSAPEPNAITGANAKYTSSDPGARFGAFDFSYRLPYLRNWLTLYADGEVHDDVSPIDAPRRASWRPGIYLSHVPAAPKLDMRVEAASTDPPITTSYGGHFMYWEFIEKQGYTNQGQMFGDWIGREAKGGQAWVTYHLSGNEWIQVNARNQKAAKDFIPGSTVLDTTTVSNGCSITNPCLTAQGGTTLNDIGFQVVKRIGKDFEVNGNFTYEHWKAPVYLPGQQTVTNTTIQLTWYPQRKVSF